MTNFIETPIRTSTNRRFSISRLGLMGSTNLVIIALLSWITFSQQSAIQITDTNVYPGALAAVATEQIPKKDPIPQLSMVFDDLPVAHLDGSNQGLKKSDVKVGEYGEVTDYDATIALVGSSHAEHWLGAVLEATKDHNYRVLSITRSGTRFSTGYPDDDLKGIWVQNVLDYLKDSDVDLVIGQATASDTIKHQIHQYMIDQLQYVHDNFGMEVLAVRDVPRYDFNVLESIEIDGVEKTTEKMNVEENQYDTEFWDNFVQSNESIHKLDITEYFLVDNEFQPVIGNIVIYRDNRHLTNSFSKSFGPLFEEKMIEILEEE